LKWRSN